MTKTILMIHGFGAAGDSWKPVAASFAAAGYAVETPTIHAALRTVGPPPPGLAGKTLSDYVAEMSALAQSLAQRDGAAPIVFGHSMGGLIAQKLAEAGLASGLVLFAPASPADARGKPKLSPVFTFLNIAATAKPETKAVKIWKTGFKWGVLNQTPADRHDAIFATTVHDSGRALSDLAYPDRDPNRTVHVDAAKVTVPVLVLAGARDRTTPIDDVRLVARKYAGAEFREYPNNAHWLIDEPGSAEILAEVKTWLEAKGLGAQAPVVAAASAEKPAKAPAAKAKPAAAADVPAPAPAVKTKAPPKSKAAPVAATPTPPPAAKVKTPAKAASTPAVKVATPAAKAPAIQAKPAKAPAARAKPAAPAVKAKAAPAKVDPAPTPASAAKAKAPAKTASPPAAKLATPAAKAPAIQTKPAKAPAARAAALADAPAAPASAAKAKAPAKAATPAPSTAKTSPTTASKSPPLVAEPAPKAKPAAEPATKAKVAKPKPDAVAKPAPAKAPAAVKAPSKPAVTKSTAKSSPATKKSV